MNKEHIHVQMTLLLNALILDHNHLATLSLNMKLELHGYTNLMNIIYSLLVTMEESIFGMKDI